MNLRRVEVYCYQVQRLDIADNIILPMRATNILQKDEVNRHN